MAAPVKNTCPDIDSVIRSIEAASKYAAEGMNDNERGTDNYYLFSQIYDSLCRLDDKMEDLRKANDALRSWGIGLEDELESAANYINELEDKIEL